MPGIVQAIAIDLDGTLTADDRLSAAALSAIDAVRREGLAVGHVTGRIVRELMATVPGLVERFDAVVAENGAVLALGDDIRDLTEPVEDALGDALARDAIGFRRGRVLLAGAARDAQTVLDAVGALGLDCQLVRNRGELMVLPAGVSKASGLLAALAELGISIHNTVAIGDAENDLSLLHAAEIGVAVANAVPSLRAHADLVHDEPNGTGVAALHRRARQRTEPHATAQPYASAIAVGDPRRLRARTATAPGVPAHAAADHRG